MNSAQKMARQTRLANFGTVISVRGSVVDVRFDDHLPAIYSVLRTGEERQIVIEVLAQRDAHHVRGISLTPTQGLARGMSAEDTGGPLMAPVGKAIRSRMFDVFGNVIDREPALSDVEWLSVHRAPSLNEGAKHPTAFSREIGGKAARKLKAQRNSTHGVWFDLGMMGLVGWSVVVPTLLGAALGIWLDNRHPGALSWTLSLLIIGLTIGCVNAWYWVRKEEAAMREEQENHDD